MNTREIASKYRLEQWTQAIQERVSNGESIKEFCESKGISRNTYFYWQRKLREAACQDLQPTVSNARCEAVIPHGWAVCEEAGADSPTNTVSIEIGKCRVNVGAGVSADQLEKICRVLMRLC